MSGIVKTLKECQPFKDGAATLVCVGCFKMLAFPSGAKRVRCGNCSIVTDGITVRCTSCKEKLKARLGTTMITCKKCGYKFKPMAKLKVNVPHEKRVEDVLVPLTITVSIDSCIYTRNSEEPRKKVVKLLPNQPLQTSAEQWGELFGANFHGVSYFKNGKKLNAGATPRELDIVNSDEIVVKQVTQSSNTGHQFVVAQFGQPTNCAYCKEFIWGIYHQGKKCAKCHVPVHHRCAEKFKSTCEADLRDLFGIVNYNDEDDEGLEEPVLGVVIDDEDKIDFQANVQEAVEPECDPNKMCTFDKLGGFSDDEIQNIWVEYDRDETGALERDEARAFLIDLLKVGGGEASKSSTSDEAVDRFIKVMDTNDDGIIQWEEFWYFFKAQQDNAFLNQFKGVTLTTEQLYDMWYQYDADGSGALEAEELLRLFGDICQLRGDTATKFASGSLASFLQPGASVTWDEFCTTIVPVLKASLKEDTLMCTESLGAI